MKLGNTIKKTALLVSLSVLSSACSFSTTEGVIRLDDGYKKVKGTVTKLVNLVIPTAYAAEDSICRSQKSGQTTNVMEVYLLENGVETKICDADILSNGEFEVELKEELVPSGAVVLFKSQFNGAVREKLATSSEIKSSVGVEVSPFTTAVSNSLKSEAHLGRLNQSKITKAAELVEGVFGSDVKIGASTSLANFIKEATANASYKAKALSYLSGSVDLNDDLFKNIKTQVNRVKNGRSVAFSEELFSTPQSTLKTYAYFKKSRETDNRRTPGHYNGKRIYSHYRMVEFLRSQFGVEYSGRR